MKREITIRLKLSEPEIEQMAELDVGSSMNMTQQVIVGSAVHKCRRWIKFCDTASIHIDNRLRFAFIPDTLYDGEFSTFVFLPDVESGPVAKIYKAKDHWYCGVTQQTQYSDLRSGHPGAKEFPPCGTQWAAMLVASNYLINYI